MLVSGPTLLLVTALDSYCIPTLEGQDMFIRSFAYETSS
jgi:hypothetical protein